MQKVLVITGGSKGIGYETARLFQQQGYKIINISRSPLRLADVINISSDMSQTDWLATSRQTLLAAIGDCHQIQLIHCAAALRKDSVTNVSQESLQEVMQIAVFAPTELNQVLLPKMGSGSSIIYVGSTLSEKAVANSFSYVTSKHAIAGAMRATCQDLAETNIHTACVCPGFTDTDMLRAHVGESEEILTAIAEGVTFKRLLQPEEVAKTLYFCATTPAINGSVIHANLGQIES
jgi:3-oxoacyl-[acyl-carrier protein] reductase